MWWVLPGLVAGLVASSLMIAYWFYRLRHVLAEKDWRYTCRLWIFTWIAVFVGSASGLLRMSMVIAEGSVIDSALVYASAILYWAALAAMFTGIILDVVKGRFNTYTR